jgi:hypothetical protein
MNQHGIVTVFVSSTWLDLGPERRALEFVLGRFDETKLVGMEHFGSRDEDPRTASLAEVDRSDVYIGVIGARYGSGITEDEYDRARANRIPCLFYVKTAAAAAEPDPEAHRRARFLDRVRTAHVVSEFRDADELATRVAVDLHKWLLARKLRGALDDADRDLAAVAGRVRQSWIKGVLERAVTDERRIQLGTAMASEAVAAAWSRHVTVMDGDNVVTTAADDPIASIFDDASRSLLILGAPGSGKTMTLLELTRDLLHFYEARIEQSIPVVLSLASWQPTPDGFAGWAIRELRSQYFVPRDVALRWLAEGRLYLMLDGLDEVPGDSRAACVEAVNTFVRDGRTAGIAVTCRLEEYERLETRFAFYGAIRLLPLDDDRITRYFEALGPGSEALRQRVAGDEELHELARSPLMLNVMTAAIQSAPVQDLRRAPADSLRDRLFALYVSGMFRRRQVPPDKQRKTLQWLSWLAAEMRRNSWALFSLDRFQPRLLESTASLVAYSLLVWTITLGGVGALAAAEVSGWGPLVAVVCGFAAVDVVRLRTTDAVANLGGVHARRARYGLWLILYLLVPLTMAWLAGDDPDAGFLAIVLGAFTAFRLASRGCDDDVQLLDQVGWAWSGALRGAVLAMVIVSLLFQIGCATFEIFGEPDWSDFFRGLRVWWAHVIAAPGAIVTMPVSFFAEFLDPGWIAAAVVGGLMGGMTVRVSSGPAHVYSRFRATALRMLIGGGCFGVVVGMVVGSSETSTVLEVIPVILAYAPLGFIWFGGVELIRHLAVRVVLAVTRRFPFASVRVLEDAAGLALVRRVGAGYGFMHRLLLDHLAGLSRAGRTV